MKRLTWWIDEDTPLVDVCVDSNTDGTGCPYMGSVECSVCDIAENAVRRLAEYEDTGLSPEQVREMKEKQIPKVPDWEGCNSFYSDNIEAYCPECDYYFKHETACCPDCGQAID